MNTVRINFELKNNNFKYYKTLNVTYILITFVLLKAIPSLN